MRQNMHKNGWNQAMWMALFIAVSATQAVAQEPVEYVWKERSEGGYTYRYVENDPMQARFYTLKNGLTVILSPTDKQPRIQVYITTKAGGKHDPADHTGLAHYLEHMLFKGTSNFGTVDWAREKPLLDQIDALYERYNHTTDEAERTRIYQEIDRVSGEAAQYAIANEYDKIMGSIGATGTNAFTSYDQTAYTEDIPANAVDQFLAVQAERFKNPVFRLFHTELETVYEEKNMSLDNDSRKVMEALFASNFPHHNYGKQTILGSVEHLKNPSLKAIREFYETYYVPNHMAVVMSGDFDPTEMVTKVDRAFSYMQPREIPAVVSGSAQPIIQPIIREVFGPNPEFIALTYRLPGAGTREARMLELVSSMLSNRSAGLIDLNIVKAQTLLGASAFPYILNDYSLLVIQGTPLQGQTLDQARDLLLAELENLKRGTFSEDLIPSIVNNERKAQLSRNEGYKGRAEDLMGAFAAELDWAEELRRIDWLSRVTKKDVMDFAQQYFGNNNYVAVYKRQGADPNTVKVVKPAITPVEVNRTAQSDFFTAIQQMPEQSIEPVWVDYEQAIQRGKLDGLDVFATKNRDNELFSLSYHFQTGSWDNKLLGLAAGYLEFLGTADRSSEQFSTEFYQLATDFRISPGNEETMISIAGLNSNFLRSVQLVQELIHGAIADEQAFQSYIARLKRSRANAKENKNAIAEGLLAYAKYGPQNPFNYTLTDAELDQLRPEDLIAAIRALGNTEHTVLYYGPLSVAELTRQIVPLKTAEGAYLPAGQEASQFAVLPTTENKVYFANFPMNQVDITWFRNADVYDNSRTPLISLFNSYFGGGMGSIVFQTIRESKALAYSTYANYGQPSRAGQHDQIRAYVGTQADKFMDAVKGMNKLLNDLPESSIALNAAKTNLLKSLASQRTTGAAVLNSFINARRLGLTTDIRQEVYEQAKDMDFADLQRFHASAFSGQPYTYCVVGDESSLNVEEMNALGRFQKLSLEEIFGY